MNPSVSFGFNTSGARKFAQVTQETLGKPFAIILDNQVISAPVIREPILGGSGQTPGSFTVKGQPPRHSFARGRFAVLATIIEERTVGPGLGQGLDRQGKVLVLCRRGDGDRFHAVTYGFWTVRQPRGGHQRGHDLRRARHCSNATLTLPGIAGIVLTVGIAVDLNGADLRALRRGAWRPNADQRHLCRIFTRARHHSRFQHHDIHCGRGAVYIGTGSVRGFAVTLGIGIITTVFIPGPLP